MTEIEKRQSVADTEGGRVDPRSRVYSFAASIGRALSKGDVAGLRRMDPQRLDAPGFWKLAALHLEGELTGEAAARHNQETSWATVAVALAHLGDLQVRGRRMGSVLADVGYSEQRFVRLLRADPGRLHDELSLVARFLAAKSAAADFADAALLLVGLRPEESRRHLARDYYSALAKRDA